MPASDANLTAVLLTYGPLGIVLAWFMIRGEAKLERIVDRLDFLSHKINGITKAMLVDVISRDDADSRARQIAQTMLTEMERESEKKRPG